MKAAGAKVHAPPAARPALEAALTNPYAAASRPSSAVHIKRDHGRAVSPHTASTARRSSTAGRTS
jgi:hypothetical protein